MVTKSNCIDDAAKRDIEATLRCAAPVLALEPAQVKPAAVQVGSSSLASEIRRDKPP